MLIVCTTRYTKRSKLISLTQSFLNQDLTKCYLSKVQMYIGFVNNAILNSVRK